jgi:glycerophosphoryl diester phosphodiesterase
LRLNIELKCGRLDDQGLAEAAAHEIRALGLSERTIVSSFNPGVLARYRRREREVPVGFLFAADQAWHYRSGLWARVARAQAVHPEAALCTPARVARWHRRGWLVNTWTVDDPVRIAELARMGVDAIITNRPEVARMVVDAVAA